VSPPRVRPLCFAPLRGTRDCISRRRRCPLESIAPRGFVRHARLARRVLRTAADPAAWQRHRVPGAQRRSVIFLDGGSTLRRRRLFLSSQRAEAGDSRAATALRSTASGVRDLSPQADSHSLVEVAPTGRDTTRASPRLTSSPTRLGIRRCWAARKPCSNTNRDKHDAVWLGNGGGRHSDALPKLPLPGEEVGAVGVTVARDRLMNAPQRRALSLLARPFHRAPGSPDSIRERSLVRDFRAIVRCRPHRTTVA